MKQMWIVGMAWLVLSTPPCLAELQPLPMAGVTAVSFSSEDGGKVVVSDIGKLGHVERATIENGKIVLCEDGKNVDWNVAAEEGFGKGRLDITLNRERLTGDVALVLNASLNEKSSLAVQLYDGTGGALALDLFGEIKANAEAVGTDTFIVPLVKYPAAKRLVLRRLSGDLRVREVLLMPVVAEVESAEDADRDLAARLGERLSEFNRLSVRDGAASSVRVHRIPSLEEINTVGASVLAAAGYPVYKPLGILSGGITFAPVSGTTYEFAKLADRMLSLGREEPVFDWFFTSSNGVHWYFSDEAGAEKKVEFGMTSMPMSSEAKQAYFDRTGHAVIEFPIARSAIEVLVHAGNPLDSISAAGLKAAFGAEGKAETWRDLGVLDGPLADEKVRAIGGSPSWGTGRMFQEIALGGGPWRPDVDARHDVVYSNGVELTVSEQPGGIGYAVQGSRRYPVKVIALASTDGSGPTFATEETIYSGRYPLQRKLYAVVAAPSLAEAPPAVREIVNLLLSDQGQTLMVRTRSLPLAADEVVEWRKRLGL